MPVEIRELHVKIEVAGDNNARRNGKDQKAASADQQALVEQCVEQVMEILKQSKER